MSDIFADDPLPKAFYHPSRQRRVDHLKNEACLASDRVSEEQLLELDRQDREFLKGGYTYTYSMPDGKKNKYPPVGEENSGRFDESWPASERPSTVSIPDLSETLDYTIPRGQQVKGGPGGATYSFQVPERDTDSGKRTQGAKTVDSSTLSKYIDRFRHGQPTSREEREKLGAVKEDDFWWLNKTSPSDTSTPIEDSGSKTKRFTPRMDHSRGAKGEKKGSYMSLKEYSTSTRDVNLHQDLRLLHDKADRLLEKTGSSLNSSEPVVSTEGLGSVVSTGSDTPRTVEEQPYRPTFTAEPHKFSKPLKPEDDILVQWRRNRKVELMKTCEVPPLHKTGNSDLENKLAAFRMRLAATLADGQNSGQIPSVTIDTVKTSDIPKSSTTFRKELSKQVDSECQTCPLVTPRESRIDKIPASSTDNPSRPHIHSPIASPNLPRTKALSPGVASSTRDVEPHLHLSCDIIPCPVIHTQQYHADANMAAQTSTGHRGTDKHKGKGGKGKTQEMSYKQEDFYTPESGVSEESDSSFELMKRKHLRLLREEQELLKQVSRLGQGRKGSCKEDKRDFDLPTSDQKPRLESEGVKYQKREASGSREGRGETTGEYGDLVCSDESFTDVTELQPPSKPSSGYSRQQGRSGRVSSRGQGHGKQKDATEKSATHHVKEYTKKGSRVKPNECIVRTGEDSKEKAGSGQRHLQQGHQGSRSPVSKKGFGHVPTPQVSVNDSQEGPVIDKLPRKSQSRKAGPRPLHSSPMPSLNSAIGQVVGDHLFMSSVSFASSVDSLPRSTIYEQPEAALSQDENFEAAIQSDGEEFKEDEILRDLRKRREMYLDKLKCIDALTNGKLG